MLSSILAQSIWYGRDSLVALPQRDSISYMEDYTVFAVLRNTDTVASVLWTIMENDTCRWSVYTSGVFSSLMGYTPFRKKRDFSQWSVYFYRSGIQLDSLKMHTLVLGDSVATIKMEEFVYMKGFLKHSETASWQTYLALKYGVTLDAVAYISTSGDTLWSPIEDEQYYHRVVGIGGDSIHGWFVNSSKSKENASLLLATVSPLSTGNYILVGDDDAVESWILQPDGSNRLSRTWRLRQNLSSASPFSIIWHPSCAVPVNDSIFMVATDSQGQQIAKILPDSIVGDSAYWFTCCWRAPSVNLSFHDVHSSTVVTPEQVCNTAGTISINSLDPDKVYSYALYTNVGQLLFRPAASRPTNINVGYLGIGVYRLDVYDLDKFITSVPIYIH